MRKKLSLAAVLILSLSLFGFSDSLSFRMGYFIPQAKSDLWEIEFENMSFTRSNFNNLTFAFTYERFLSREFSFIVGFETYNKTEAGNYIDYVGLSFDEGDFAFPNFYEGDFEIVHSFNVSMTPFFLSFKLAPIGRRSGLIPYVGGGPTFYFWNVRLTGDIVDFEDIWYYEDPDLGDVEIYGVYGANAQEQSRFTVGFHVFGGLSIPFGRNLSLDAEFKYNYGKGTLKVGFQGFDEPFDLSGYQITFGVTYWF